MFHPHSLYILNTNSCPSVQQIYSHSFRLLHYQRKHGEHLWNMFLKHSSDKEIQCRIRRNGCWGLLRGVCRHSVSARAAKSCLKSVVGTWIAVYLQYMKTPEFLWYSAKLYDFEKIRQVELDFAWLSSLCTSLEATGHSSIQFLFLGPSLTFFMCVFKI